jgi:hypothetical protein
MTLLQEYVHMKSCLDEAMVGQYCQCFVQAMFGLEEHTHQKGLVVDLYYLKYLKPLPATPPANIKCQKKQEAASCP